MISDKNKVIILWSLFVLTIIIPLINIFLNNFGLFSLFITILQFSLPIFLLGLHSFYLFGLRNTILLLTPPFIIGLLFEIIGVNFGVVFGGHYFYHPSSLGPLFFGVPISIPFFWSFFVYTGYLISSSFLVWSNISKPSKLNKKLWLLLLLIVIDGLIVVAIDIFMDPIMVARNSWTWVNGGAFFGIPLGNFVGWFLVTVMSSGIFRTFEYFFPVKKTTLSSSLLLIPVIGYLSLSLVFLVLALNLGLNRVAVIGLSLMLPIALINLGRYVQRRTNKIL